MLSLEQLGLERILQGGTDEEQQGLLSNSLSVKQLCPLNPVRCLLVNTIKLSIMCVNSYLIASQMCEIYVFLMHCKSKLFLLHILALIG